MGNLINLMNKVKIEEKNNLNSKNNEETFIKNPNLKYKTNIITHFDEYRMFDIYTLYKDKKEYIALPNVKKASIDIYLLLNNQKISSLKGFEDNAYIVKYFINLNNNNEYLISKGDWNNAIILVWDITDNYKMICKYNPSQHVADGSCLLIFPHFLNDIFAVTCTANDSSYDCCYTEIYSLNQKKLYKKIEGSNTREVDLLLSWYNKKNNNYYIIQLERHRISIVNLFKNEIYWESVSKIDTFDNEEYFRSGYIYYNNNKDYLFTFSGSHNLTIWDLYKKNIFKSISLDSYKNCCTFQCRCKIIPWKEYVIIYHYKHNKLKIFDLKNNKIISVIDIFKDK